MQRKFVAPPVPTGSGSGGCGYTASGRTNTEFGDAVEAALCEQLGFTSLLDPGHRQGPFDVTRGGVVWEVKAVTVESSEYKVRARKADLDRKRNAAAAAGLVAGVVMVVVDTDGTGWCYARRELGSFRLTNAFEFLGTIEVEV